MVLLSVPLPAFGADGLLGYYRQPALHGDTLVFHAEGDLWKVPAAGGAAQRLTTHLERERFPEISPEGSTIAFTASYEGPTEIYIMSIAGGKPVRLTYEGVSGRRAPYPVGWKSRTELVYATWYFARRDTHQLAVIDIESGRKTVVPLEQASDGVYSPDGKTIYFTRLPRQGSHAKRYKGGLIENLWRYTAGEEEALPLTGDYDGTSRAPMLWNGRLYFATDRDGTMNLWSMDLDGKDLKQHTKFSGWDVLTPSLQAGRIVFQNRADLWIYDVERDETRVVPIRLASDFDQTRERWVANPFRYLGSYYLSPDGKEVAVTVRGRGFVVPVKPGRVVRIPQDPATRYRDLQFFPGSDEVFFLSDQSGEIEFWRHAANGLGESTRLTRGSTTTRHKGILSPNGKLLAHTDRNQVLWLLDLASGKSREVARSYEGNEWDSIDLAWSPDSRWMAFVDVGENRVRRIFLHDTQSEDPPVAVTTDRLDSYNPSFGAAGKWLYCLSDRTFRSVQGSPWGARQPEALLDKTTSLFLLDLVGGQRSPFGPDDELSSVKEVEPKKPAAGANGEKKEEKKNEEKKEQVVVKVDGLAGRLHAAPLEAGNYRGLSVAKENLYYLRSELELGRDWHLTTFPITRDGEKQKWANVVSDVGGYEISGDGTTCLVRKGDDFHVFPANGKAPANFAQAKVSFAGLSLNVSPADEWRQMFADAWRMHRDYFYDPAMHQVDWDGVRRKHEVLLRRLTSRWELDDLIGQMVGELSAMHTDIWSGDVRDATDGASQGYLGARLERGEEGYVVRHIYETDPDYPADLSPLLAPGVELRVGDVILSIDGTATISVPDIAILLRNKAGQRVLLESRRLEVPGTRKSIVVPLSLGGFRNLKTSNWEHTRRMETEKLGDGEIGYFHMRGMSASNYSEFVKGYYPVFNRKGLVIDMRQNYGGNIDSWILGRLSRKPWMFWKSRTGRPFANMQYAFNGHMVVVIDAYTISDGEAFAEGFRRLGLGPLVGTRTWGGGIWLRGNTRLVDGGMARSPETGMYSPSKVWLVEGRGVQPDIVVDNLPHQAFLGKDAQLEAAVAYLRKKIEEDPPKIPEPPPRPDKAFDYPPRK